MTAAPTVLDRRSLSRATLARQHLLGRATMPALDLAEHLVGLQSQTPQTWYVGFWTRLAAFDPAEVSDLLEQRGLVRVALMRSTIHLVSGDDALALRALLRPVIERMTLSTYRARLAGVDLAALAEAGRVETTGRALTFSQLSAALLDRFPVADPSALAQWVRATSTLVQVPPRGLWGRSGTAAHQTAESWLGRDRPRGGALTVDALVLRYLRAFGPASVRDAQVWSGLTRLAEVFERLRPGLLVFRDEAGVELFDRPEAPRPPADTEAPLRYLYDFDNLLLSHADRSRVVSQEYREQDVPPNGAMPRPVLVDGFVRGVWTVDLSRESGREAAVLHVRPLSRWPAAERAAAVPEGLRLLGFLHPGADHEVRVETVRTAPRV